MAETPPETASSGAVTDGGGSTGDSLVRAVVGMGRGVDVGLVPGQLVADTYRIVRQLGAGGMGVVYLARDQRLGRDVALKLHATDASTRSVERLAREASAIAQLSHANVVTVYQIDTHEGRPFVAMEYVDGGTARTWLAAQPRRWREIVALYLDAGRGLAAAHAAGLVHRDFKPDNVLVGTDGRVRVADFGLVQGDVPVSSSDELASDDGAAVGAATPLTRTGAVMGTPAYMAPEQHHGGTVGAAADQFAFAVALWEALAGDRPFVGGSVGALRAAQSRPLAPPARPMPRQIEAALRRALALEPAARWPAMTPLLTALARDPARTRRRAIGAAAVVVALAGGSVAIASRSGAAVEPPCQHAADGLAAAEARRASLTAPAGDPAMSRLDAWMASWRSARVTACEATHVRRTQPLAVLELRNLCLDRARASLEATLGELPAAKDRSPLVDALPGLAECANELRLSSATPLPQDPAARAEIEALSALIAQVEVTQTAGHVPEALAAITALIPRVEATGRKALAAEAQLALGSAHIANNKLDGVITMFESAARLAAEAGDDHMVARAWMSVFDLYVARLEKPEEAERVLKFAEHAVIRAGNSERLRSDLLGSIGELQMKRGDLSGARKSYEEAIVLHTRVFGENAELARKLNRLAAIATRLDDPDAARTHLQRAAAVLERNYGPRFRHLGVIWTTQGQLELRVGNFAEARVLLERALALKEETSGPDSVVVVPTLTDLAMVLIELQELDLAERHVRRALDIARKVLGPEHVKVVEAARTLAKVQVAREDWTGAEQTLRDTLAIQRRIGNLTPADSMELELAHLLLRDERFAEARAAVARARVVAQAEGDDAYMMAKVYEMTGIIELAAGNRDVALGELRRAMAILEKRRPADHPEMQELQSRLDAAQ